MVVLIDVAIIELSFEHTFYQWVFGGIRRDEVITCHDRYYFAIILLKVPLMDLTDVPFSHLNRLNHLPVPVESTVLVHNILRGVEWQRPFIVAIFQVKLNIAD